MGVEKGSERRFGSFAGGTRDALNERGPVMEQLWGLSQRKQAARRLADATRGVLSGTASPTVAGS
jgi:hypothetical protein